jgi:glycerol-3-phosphate cytidylyltransferase-like family protein
MDTRSKIVDTSRLRASPPAAVVTGYFDPLLAWHARELEDIRGSAGALAIIVLPLACELLPQSARAALVAALRAVDRVLIGDNGNLDRLFAELKPQRVVRLEDDDLRRRAELMEHVRR